MFISHFAKRAIFAAALAVPAVSWAGSVPLPAGTFDPLNNSGVGTTFNGAVYAMTNKTDGNSVAAFGRNADGTLSPINEFSTGGLGFAPAGGSGLDPLITQNSLVAAGNQYLLASNPGSNSVTAFRINRDFTLTQTSVASTGGVGPASIAYRDGLVYVANLDSDGVFTGPADQTGNVTALRLDNSTGQLTPVENSTRQLGYRPADANFSPNGDHLLVSAFNAGSSALPAGSNDEILVYGVEASGQLSPTPIATATGTLPGNSEGRNLPSAIGFEVVERGGREFVVVTESREFTPDGGAPLLPNFQTGSVSTWELQDDGMLTAIVQDVLTGPSATDGPTSACWITFSPDLNTFYVASASGSAISSFSFDENGMISLIDGLAASGVPVQAGPAAGPDGFIDIAMSSDGNDVYQLVGLKGAIRAFEVGADGSLSFLQETSGLLPQTNTQGLVFVSGGGATAIPLPPASYAGLAMLGALGGAQLLRKRLATT